MIASVYLLYLRGGKVLLGRRQNTGYEDGKLGLPAGHVEDDESLTAAIAREVKEEIGVNIKQSDLTLVHVMHRKELDIRMDFFFTVADSSQEPKNIEPEKCSEIAWFSMDALPDDVIPCIRHAIEHYRKKIFFSERGWT